MEQTLGPGEGGGLSSRGDKFKGLAQGAASKTFNKLPDMSKKVGSFLSQQLEGSGERPARVRMADKLKKNVNMSSMKSEIKDTISQASYIEGSIKSGGGESQIENKPQVSILKKPVVVIQPEKIIEVPPKVIQQKNPNIKRTISIEEIDDSSGSDKVKSKKSVVSQESGAVKLLSPLGSDNVKGDKRKHRLSVLNMEIKTI